MDEFDSSQEDEIRLYVRDEPADVDGQDIAPASVSTDDGTIGGDPILGGPSSSTDTSLTLGGSWTVLDSSNPTLLVARLEAETDGTTRGEITVAVDESGGTTLDYRAMHSLISPGAGSGARNIAGAVVYVPAGASVQVQNSQDPAGNNTLLTDQVFTL